MPAVQTIKNLLLAERVNGRIMGCGLDMKKQKKEAKDERNIRYKWLGGFFGGYEPKRTTHIIPTLSTKFQHRNTCTQESATLQAEVDEGEVLSEQSLTCFAKEEGAITGDGFSSLSLIQSVQQKKGIARKSLLDGDDTNWEEYSNSKNLTPEIRNDAQIHRSKSRVYIKSRDEAFKALDDNRIIHDGSDWYSGYNMGGGLRAPWILPMKKGYKIGGHAYCRIGYDMKYLGIHQVFICKQSSGEQWGDTREFTLENGKKIVEHGLFYIRVDDWYGALGSPVGIVRVDLDNEQEQYLMKQYEGKQVKGNASTIYYIENGTKRPFPDATTYYAFGGRFGKQRTWVPIADSVLKLYTDGPMMDITDSPAWPALQANWPTIKTLQNPNNFKAIDEIINAQNAFNSSGLANVVNKIFSLFK